MQVTAASANASLSIAASITRAGQATGGATAPATDPAPTTTREPDPIAVDPAPSPEPARARGVLRNLASGHFRGVAALRLRENFAEEIESAGIKVPDPEPAPGRGRAYERLLARYRAASAPVGPDPQLAVPAVDTQA